VGRFLRENWIWIVAPIALVVALLALVIVSGSQGDAAFIYPIW
jgi:hypothetical protein